MSEVMEKEFAFTFAETYNRGLEGKMARGQAYQPENEIPDENTYCHSESEIPDGRSPVSESKSPTETKFRQDECLSAKEFQDTIIDGTKSKEQKVQNLHKFQATLNLQDYRVNSQSMFQSDVNRRQEGRRLGGQERKMAFTLAETLITLVIVGIVAAVTVPILIDKYQDLQYKTAYRKAYSDAARAWNLMATKNEIEVRKDNFSGGMLTNDFPNFKKYFNIADNNSKNANAIWENGECFSSCDSLYHNNAFIDINGRAWTYISDGHLEAAFIFVDINGAKKPNVLGKDRFPFVTLGTNCQAQDFYKPECNTNIIPSRLLPMMDCTNTTHAVGRYCKSAKKCYYTTWLK